MGEFNLRIMRDRMNVYFPPELLKQIADLADRKRLSRSAIVEAAVASFLSPDGADKREADQFLIKTSISVLRAGDAHVSSMRR